MAGKKIEAGPNAINDRMVKLEKANAALMRRVKNLEGGLKILQITVEGLNTRDSALAKLVQNEIYKLYVSVEGQANTLAHMQKSLNTIMGNLGYLIKAQQEGLDPNGNGEDEEKRGN